MKRKKFKKALSLSLAFLLIIGVVFPTVSEIAEAKTYYVEHKWMAETEVFGTSAWGVGCKVLIGKENPQVGFCIEPGVDYVNGNHSTIKPSDIGLTQAKMDKLALIAYYGYRDKTHNNTNYCLTQSLIWKELGSKKRVGIGKYKNESAMKPWFDAVMKKVNRFNVKPSFNGKTYTVNVGVTKSIKDTKGVLSELKIRKVTGGKATISGDTLKVTPDGSSATMKIHFKREIAASQTKTNFVLRSGKAQSVSPCLSGGDPYSASLNIKVNRYGSIKLSKESESGKAVKGAKFKAVKGSTTKTGTTNASGVITFSNLTPGKWKVSETTAPNPYLLDTTAKEVTVTANKTANVSFTNDMARGKFTLTKTKENGKALQGAKFRIWSTGTDPEGSTIGYDKTFTTDASGKINVTGLKLGKYNYQEKAAPSGYLLDDTVRTFTLTYKDQNTAVVTSTGTVKNMMPRGKFTLTKTATDSKGLKGAEFRITSLGADPEGNTIGYDKTFTTDSSGKINATGLKLGTYKWEEVKAPDGYALDKNNRGEFTLTYKDQNTAVVLKTANVTNKYVEVQKDNNDGNFLEGAILQVEDKDSNVIDKWTTSKKEGNHKIKGLVVGEAYTLREIKAPTGYVISEPVAFVVTDKEDQVVKMVDKQVKFIKEDVKEKPIYGGIFELLDEKGEVMYEFTAKEDGVILEGLVEGKTYTVREVEAPDGFVRAKEVTFTVSYDKALQEVKMTDKKVEFIKKDVDGNVLSGMEYTVTHEKTKNIVDKGVTNAKGRTFLKNLAIGETYTITETKTPDGYVTATPVTFTVKELTKEEVNGEEKLEDQVIEMVDKRVDVYKKNDKGEFISGAELKVVDSDGEIVDSWTSENKVHHIKNLVEGKKYTLIEDYAPDGFVIAKPIDFEVPKVKENEKKENQKIEMFDKQVEFFKTDEKGNVITGMEYKVTNKKTKKIVDSGITNAKDRTFLNGLMVGETYIITETKTPKGFATAAPKEFTVSEDTKLQKETMVDKQVKFIKEDVKEKPIYGGLFELLDEKGKVMYEFTAKEDGVILEGLVEGKTYTVREVEAPDGFVRAKEVTFTVSYDKALQEVKMTDKKVEFIKKDVDGNVLSGMEYTVTHEKTKNIVDKGVTNAKGRTFLKNLAIGETYTITETKTPDGYVTATPVTFTVKELTKEEVNEEEKLEDQVVEMVDKQVKFKKLGRDEKTLTGGKFHFIDPITNEVVAEIVPEEDFVIVPNLKENKEYIIKEVEAPYGYQIGEDIRVFITKDKSVQYLTMKDEPKIGRLIIGDANNIDGELVFMGVETKDNFPLMMAIVLLLVGGIGTIIFAIDSKGRRKKK